MDCYKEMVMLPDPEFPATILLNAVYTKLHKALCDLNATNIGVSFPMYKLTLGNVLRMHGAESDLRRLEALNWLGGLSGYCEISDIKTVPKESKFRTVSRKQINMSQSKLKRLIKRGSITEEEVNNYKTKMFTKGLDNPYVELKSGSNGQKHRRYFVFGDLSEEPIEGQFDQFGLSKTATVPWFD